jgi:CBS domain-containing protein
MTSAESAQPETSLSSDDIASSAPGITTIAHALGRFERPIVTAKLDDTAFDVACRMRDQHVGCVVVVRDGRPVGILTDRDLVLRVVAEGLDAQAVLVSSIVTYDAMTVSATDGFETAVRKMREHGIRRLPIVDGEGRVTGIVTADDLVALLSRELSVLGEAISSNVDGTESR